MHCKFNEVSKLFALKALASQLVGFNSIFNDNPVQGRWKKSEDDSFDFVFILNLLQALFNFFRSFI